MKKKLTDAQLNNMMQKVSKPAFNVFKKRLLLETDKVKTEFEIDVNDAINLAVQSLVSINLNVFTMLKKICNAYGGGDTGFDKIIQSYMDGIKDAMKSYKEKMN